MNTTEKFVKNKRAITVPVKRKHTTKKIQSYSYWVLNKTVTISADLYTYQHNLLLFDLIILDVFVRERNEINILILKL